MNSSTPTINPQYIHTQYKITDCNNQVVNPQQKINYTNEPPSPLFKISTQSRDFIQRVMINVGLLSFLMGYGMVYFNAIKFDDLMIIFDLQFDKAFAQGFFTACIPASACVGALLSKVFLSAFTRKQCFDAMNVMFICAILLIQTKVVALIIVGRLLQGTFIGVGSAIIPLYIKQFIPQMNGKYGLYHQLLFTIGVVWAFLFNLLLHSIFAESVTYWRWLFGFPIIVSIYQAYMVYTHYNFETPRYLVSIHRDEDAKNLLRKIYKQEFVEAEFHVLYQAIHQKRPILAVQQLINEQLSVRRSNNQIQKQIQLQQVGQKKNLNKQNKINLNESLLRKPIKQGNNPLAVFCALHLSLHQQIIGIGAVIVYSADIIKEVFPSLFYYYAVIVHSFGLCCVVLGLVLIQKFGRVFLLQAGASIICVCFFIAGYNFLLGEQRNDMVIVLVVILLRGTFSCTLGAIVWLYMAQIVKPNIVPYGTLINWLGATLVMFLFPILNVMLGGPGWIFISNSILCLISIIINSFTLVESKDRNELTIRHHFDEQIQTLKQYKIFKNCFQ